LEHRESKSKQTASQFITTIKLDPEALAVPLSSSFLKLPSLCTNIWFGMAVWHTRSWAKMFDSFTSILWASEENLKKKKNKQTSKTRIIFGNSYKLHEF
jgi:hypothetical protein